jgi:Tfp pilus assembly protein PilF
MSGLRGPASRHERVSPDWGRIARLLQVVAERPQKTYENSISARSNCSETGAIEANGDGRHIFPRGGIEILGECIFHRVMGAEWRPNIFWHCRVHSDNVAKALPGTRALDIGGEEDTMRHYRWHRRATHLCPSAGSMFQNCWKQRFRGAASGKTGPGGAWVLAMVMAGICLGPAAVKSSGLPQESTGTNTVMLEGRCRGPQGGAAPAGSNVTLATMSGEIAAQTQLDSSGAFRISDLQKVRYVLTIKAPGFQTYQQEVNLKYTAEDEFEIIMLTPVSTQVRRPPPALTDLKAPKDARKEFEKGQQALEKKNPKKAEGYLESAVKVYPCYARAQTDLGLALSTLRKFGKAEEALRKAIECDPGFLDSYTVLGQLLNAEKHYSESEAVLEKGVRLSPGAWQFYAELGTAKFGQGKYRSAADQFQKAEEMTPPPPADIHVKLANSFVKMRSFDRAYGEMAAYLKADPKGGFAPRIRQIMTQMKAAGVIHQASDAAGGP